MRLWVLCASFLPKTLRSGGRGRGGRGISECTKGREREGGRGREKGGEEGRGRERKGEEEYIRTTMSARMLVMTLPRDSVRTCVRACVCVCACVFGWGRRVRASREGNKHTQINTQKHRNTYIRTKLRRSSSVRPLASVSSDRFILNEFWSE